MSTPSNNIVRQGAPSRSAQRVAALRAVHRSSRSKSAGTKDKDAGSPMRASARSCRFHR